MDSQTNPIHLTRCNPALNMARFYRIELTADLFGGVQLVRSWGRLGTGGRVSREWFPGPNEAEISRAVWLKRKRSKGYLEPEIPQGSTLPRHRSLDEEC